MVAYPFCPSWAAVGEQVTAGYAAFFFSLYRTQLSVIALAQRVAPFLPMRLLLRDPYESWRYAPKVTCPTLVIAASHDEIVPLAGTERLVAAFPPDVATLRVLDGTDHNSVSGEADFWEAL